ncbi:hypothetical protein [Bradyrhizobium iriomotense]|uniref:Uncharacterized protein n=1 Tax=Bradyrhizobium iriomotense TaxID=441950 RepID=A0ABQ6B5P2_9BRAD|nr:hypothetical protein [Bradyrhizobium iriomotense]GLR89690.1 hypothetical protein GCM10007857_64040 [Bradyrhizobium iriomotense]
MSKLSRHDVRPGTASQRFDEHHHAPGIEPTIRQLNKAEIDGPRANGEKDHASARRELNASYLPLDAAIEAVLEAKDIDAVGRVGLNRTRINEVDLRAGLASLHGHDIAHDLFAFVTPRLRNPDMLRAEPYGILLERLASKLLAAPADTMAREGVVVLQQTLQWLILLRQNRNSLIEA